MSAIEVPKSGDWRLRLFGACRYAADFDGHEVRQYFGHAVPGFANRHSRNLREGSEIVTSFTDG